MDEREQDTKNTSTKTFHPLLFSIWAILAIVLITAAISYYFKQGTPITPPPVKPKPIHVALSEIKEIPWKTFQIKNRDTLATLFEKAGINKQSYYDIIQLQPVKTALETLKPKQHIHFLIDQNNNLEKLVYIISPKQYLEVIQHDNTYTANIINRELIKKIVVSHGIIHQSLATAFMQSNLSNKLLIQLVNIFNWDINFTSQIQPGDQFLIIYEQYDANDKPVKTGEILAAEFMNKNKVYFAIRYRLRNGTVAYYTPTGKNMKRQFLRAPVKYKYISSPFNSKRMHPILHIIRPHEGVDLAAPIGTPIKAAGDGEIIFRGRRGGYGKAIVIKHGGGITTLYAHMSSFASNLYIGHHVSEGQTIGYVGQTGLATGPHLHYEFRINGVHYDPMKVKLPAAKPIPAHERLAFLRYASEVIRQLNTLNTEYHLKTIPH